MAAAPQYDAIVIGGGHNGLTCAFYLARAGHKVCVLERREIVGGAAVTEEFHPGFRNSVASYSVSLLSPTVIADMDLARHGLEVKIRSEGYFVPLGDDDYFLMGKDEDRKLAEIARFSEKDAAAFPEYNRRLDQLMHLLRETLHVTPPNVGGGLGELLGAAGLGNKLRKVGIEGQRDLLDLFGKSAGETLDSWFETDVLKGVLAFDAMTGNYATPYTPGSAYVLLHHVFGEVNGVEGAWGHAMGGMGSITQAMAAACIEQGVEIRTECPVAKVLTDGNRAVGVKLESGETITARAITSNLNPKLLFGKMVEEEAVPPAFARRMRDWKCASGTLRMNVALKELPQFTCLPSDGIGRHHKASILITPSLKYIETAYDEARAHGWASQPAIEMHIPSCIDDSLAPAGQHVASLFCQHFAPELPDGKSWDDHREQAADTVIDTITRYAPNFRDAIVGKMVLTPMDLENKLGLTGGDIFHGQLRLDQLFSARPMLGYADYRMPLDGLYICGSGAHPGGGVTGIPGYNAAREMLRDLRKNRLPKRRHKAA
ncbi:NAD(P)/FAD-dependent oxidoreductase [Alteraurantiacibacter aestuarii]|uniref:Pyridine nucleotide-disulfide oxidoreductase domain-containing protein 2 n=1 Tax=Alteraurantiacibacter aestuarii TaxID=650004 RepID=A0A844ZM33_9SPHN|nr:NAD(P)/FAD-dependent oxidoreductase [Alteraurantiacibacter aestuarii]MXO88110.1 FAD-dependent oxidoreductase [Alteraurantiacibacter aestuarii]